MLSMGGSGHNDKYQIFRGLNAVASWAHTDWHSIGLESLKIGRIFRLTVGNTPKRNFCFCGTPGP